MKITATHRAKQANVPFASMKYTKRFVHVRNGGSIKTKKVMLDHVEERERERERKTRGYIFRAAKDSVWGWFRCFMAKRLRQLNQEK